MMDSQEMRRRWTDKTDAVFSRSEFQDELIYGPADHETEIDFEDCRSILFMDGEGRRGGEDVLMMARGRGHVTLPAGVQVRVVEGLVKFAPTPAASQRGSGSVVSSAYGGRAPPPTRAPSYAASSASSSFRTAPAPARGSQASTYRASPPNDAASFRAGSQAGSYARGIPLPPSRAGTSAVDDWEVLEELDGGDWDKGSIAPSESVSSVGNRGRSTYGGY